MAKMKELILLFAVACHGSAQSPLKRLYIDPTSKWESLHNSNGDGASVEIAKEFLKVCPSLVAVTRDEASADYTLSFMRKAGSGSATIYARGNAVHAFKPGFSARLRKVAETTCLFIASPRKETDK